VLENEINSDFIIWIILFLIISYFLLIWKQIPKILFFDQNIK
jgi:hypothetical protein